mmetsp:Transcript_13653/g.44923  ORF Transcript_13653/g.44923 Transcript_13653/m.44923 type:complete len:216 (-) Transcript_13653:3219-3866(-)
MCLWATTRSSTLSLRTTIRSGTTLSSTRLCSLRTQSRRLSSSTTPSRPRRLEATPRASTGAAATSCGATATPTSTTPASSGAGSRGARPRPATKSSAACTAPIGSRRAPRARGTSSSSTTATLASAESRTRVLSSSRPWQATRGPGRTDSSSRTPRRRTWPSARGSRTKSSCGNGGTRNSTSNDSEVRSDCQTGTRSSILRRRTFRRRAGRVSSR